MFQDKFPATWLADRAHQRENEHCRRIMECLGASTGKLSSATPTALDTSAANTVSAKAKTRRVCSLQLTIAISDGDAICIRIARDDNELTATIDLDHLSRSVEGEAR